MNNANNLNQLFFNYSSLNSLPDISKLNIFNSNINNYISFIETQDFPKYEEIISLFLNPCLYPCH